MKRLSRVLLLAAGLAVLSTPAPIPSRAGEIPYEQKASGKVEIEFGGQTFRVNASNLVRLRFEEVGTGLIRITLVSSDGLSFGRVSLYWVNFQQTIYVGDIPVEIPWEGTLNTEGGFVDR